MRDVEGLSTSETAEALGIGVSNVKMRLHRARLALARSVATVLANGLEILGITAPQRMVREEE